MAKCYFTYANEDDSDKAKILSHILSYLMKRIESLSKHTVSVIYDEINFRAGENFRKREKEIEDSDSILVFFTPEYKRKVESQGDFGSYREYEKIKERAKSGDESIIPILLFGNTDSSFTSEFETVIPWDISQISNQISQVKGAIRPSRELKGKLDAIAWKAIKEAKTTEFCKQRDETIKSGTKQMYERLFLDTDARKPLPPSCVISTSAHDSIVKQSTYFVIGRKGSGKSTLLNSLQNDPRDFLEKYKHLVSIDPNTIDAGYLFAYLVQKYKADLEVLGGMVRVLDVFWSVLFFLQGINIIGLELENGRIDRTDPRYRTFSQTANKLKKLLGVNRNGLFAQLSKGSICHCAVELLSDHIHNNILCDASELTPLTGAYTSFSSYNILCRAFGQRLLEKYCTCASQCTKKFFLVLDGFDTHTEDFRKATNRLLERDLEEYEFRKDFEIRLYRELLLTIYNIKNDQDISRAEQEYYSAVHFCIILSQDRYDEIAEDDRDIVKRRVCNLCWDAHDLLEMLVKRLEYYFGIECETPFPGTLLEYFYSIVRSYMPTIPTEIQITIDAHPYSMPLHNYLLRLSFWRPRDIIRNFSVIMQLSEMEGYDTDIFQNIIKKYLIGSAEAIINEEFLAEYKFVYPNLENVMLSFKGSDLIMDYDSFSQHLSQQRIISTTSEELDTTDQKLRLLYRLGVVGLYFRQKKQSRKDEYHIKYCFNEGLQPIEEFLESKDRDPQTKIVFNPILYKRLSLKMNSKEIVCNYPWEYIISNHIRKNTIRRL